MMPWLASAGKERTVGGSTVYWRARDCITGVKFVLSASRELDLLGGGPGGLR